MTFDVIATVIGCGLAIVAIGWMWYKKISFEGLITEKSGMMFKLIQTLSTVFEVIGLSIIAMEARNLSMWNALTRYILIGLLEVLTTLLFIIVFEKQLKAAAKDMTISILEIGKIILFTAPLFFCAFFITNQIYLLYLESINYIELQYDGSYTFLPFFSTVIENDPTFFSEAMIDPSTGKLYVKQRAEYGAWFMIYATPILNVLGMVFIGREVLQGCKVKLFNPRVKQDKTKQDPNTNAKKDDPTHAKTGGLKTYIPLLKLWFDIDDIRFITWLGEYTGYDIINGKDIVTSITHVDIQNKKKTSSKILEEVTARLVGDGKSEGLASIQKMTDEIIKLSSSKPGSYIALKSELEKLEKEVAEARNAQDTRRASNLTIDINSKNADIRTLKGEIEDLIKKRSHYMEEVRDVLENLNLKGINANFIDQVEKDTLELIK